MYLCYQLMTRKIFVLILVFHPEIQNFIVWFKCTIISFQRFTYFLLLGTISKTNHEDILMY